MLAWQQDSFAYAGSYDEEAVSYCGLLCGRQANITESNNAGVLVKPDVSGKQIKEEQAVQ